MFASQKYICHTNIKMSRFMQNAANLMHHVEMCAAHAAHYASCEDYINNTTQADKTAH